MKRIVLAVTVMAVWGCSKQAPAPVPVAAPVAPAAPAVARSGSLGGALEQESLRRPEGTPRAEDVMGAFKGAGVKLSSEKQHLGAPIEAAYCVGAESGGGLSLSVCEYDDAAKASAGKQMSLKAFGAITHRQIYLNKKTTLTVLESAPSAEADAEQKQLVELFAKL